MTDVRTDSGRTATGADLGWARAIWDAFRSSNVDFYPRVIEDGRASTLSSDFAVREMAEAMGQWPLIEGGDSLDDAIALARKSLDEVKGQTEYQDQKATRLLTITTFLSALSGALFARFNDSYPLGSIYLLPLWSRLLVIVGYVLFGLFIMSALSGALVTFHATRTRFKYPEEESVTSQEKDPRSHLFFSVVLRVRPRAWARSFVNDVVKNAEGVGATIRSDLRQRYLQNLVTETYLVAAKTADKLRYLQPAQSLLATSLRCLFVWLIFLGVIGASVNPIKPPITPLEVRLVPAGTPIPVVARVDSPVHSDQTLVPPASAKAPASPEPVSAPGSGGSDKRPPP